MGNGAVKTKIANLEVSRSATKLTSGGTEVIFVNEKFKHVQNTFFSKDFLDLRKGKKLKLTVSGGAVLRIGLTHTCPEENNYLQSALFEEEDGFGSGPSDRSLYLNHIKYLCYGEPGEEREYLPLEEGHVWLYVMVIFGSPNISASYDDKSLAWDIFEHSNIGIDNGVTAVCGIVLDAEKCMMRDCINPNDTYLIRWDMNLKQIEQNKPAGKCLQHGFIRVALVDEKPADVASVQLTNRDLESIHRSVIWCVESAVLEYPYSGTLAFQVDMEQREITHNVMLASVDHVITTQNLDIKDSRELYLVIELSSGSIRIEHVSKLHAEVKQSYGSILHLKKCNELSNDTAIKFKVAATGHDPCMILYGSDPKAFVIEFRDKFTLRDISLPELTNDIKMLGETKTIQVLDVPYNFEEFELQSFFSRESACGGDRIVNIKHSNTILPVWIIEYENTKVARNVLRRRTYGIEGNMVTVLPYYQALGVAINKGNKPTFDVEPFSVQPNTMLDGCQIHFFKNREKEIELLQRYMAEKSGVELIWDPDSDSDSEDEEEEERGNIHIRCMIPQSEHSKLITWKNDAKSELQRYFESYFQEKLVQIDQEIWESSLKLLRQLYEKIDFEFVDNKDDYTIRLVASKQTDLQKIANEVGKVIVPEKRKTITLTNEQSEKYLTLEAENQTRNLREMYTGVRFGVDKENVKVFYLGPESEVTDMHQFILEKMLHVKDITITGPIDVIRIANNKVEQFRNELYLKGIKGPIKIQGHSISVSLFITQDTELKEKEQLLIKNVKEMIKENTLEIRSKCHITDGEFDTLRANIETIYGSYVSMKNKKVIKIYAWHEDLENVRRDIQTFLDSHETDIEVLYVRKDAAEYIDMWKCDVFDTKPSIECKGEYYTGKILLKGAKEIKESVKTTVYSIAQDVKSMHLAISKPWLASLVGDIPLSRVVQEHQCLISVDIGCSLAEQGIPAISVLTSSLTIVKIIGANILTVNSEAIVNIASSNLKPETGIARAIMRSGGSKINDQCMAYIASNGKVNEGQAIVTSAGELGCKAIIHAVGPQAKTNDNDGISVLKKTIQSVLTMAEREKIASVAIPCFLYPKSHEPIVSSCDVIVGTVKEHMEGTQQPGQRSLNTVYLCDRRRETVADFVTAAENKLSTKPWHFFKHRLELTTDTNTADDEHRPTSARPKTGRPTTAGRRKNGSSDGQNRLRWNPGIQQYSKLPDVGEEDRQTTDTGNEDAFKGGLPFNIKISRKLRLHVIKGSIEKQQVDVIVCPTYHFPGLDGMVAKVLMNAAGPDLLAECNSLQSLDVGQVKRTGGGNLPCKHVYHILLDTSWGKGTYKRVYDLVKTSVQTADRYKCTSIAFPAFGIGASKYPADKVAEAIIAPVVEFGSKSHQTSLTDVYIVVFHQDFGPIRTFETCIPVLFAPTQAIGNPRNDNQDARHGLGNMQQRKLKIAPFMQTQSRSENGPVNDVVLFKIISQKPIHVIPNAIHDMIDGEFIEEEIKFNFDHKEEKLSNDETTEIRSLAERYQLSHRIETVDGKPVLKLTGFKSHVRNALAHFQDVVIRDIPNDRLKKKMGKQIADYVQWLYEDKGTKKEVSEEYNLELYIGYKSGKNFKYMNGNTEYEVDVANLQEYPVGHQSRKRRLYLRNKVMTGIKVPNNWNIALNEDQVCQVELDPSDVEFQNIKTEFLKAGATPKQILKIIRIENRTMWLQYESRKQQMDKQNSGINNEKKLWHGTDADTAVKIVKNGYDRSFVGTNANVFGRGVYFAVKSSYSQDKTYAKPDGNDVQRMFYNDVLTGYYTKLDSSEAAVLPVNPLHGNAILYDSAVNDMAHIIMYIIFHDTQAYPRYLIEFTSH